MYRRGCVKPTKCVGLIESGIVSELNPAKLSDGSGRSVLLVVLRGIKTRNELFPLAIHNAVVAVLHEEDGGSGVRQRGLGPGVLKHPSQVNTGENSRKRGSRLAGRWASFLLCHIFSVAEEMIERNKKVKARVCRYRVSSLSQNTRRLGAPADSPLFLVQARRSYVLLSPSVIAERRAKVDKVVLEWGQRVPLRISLRLRWVRRGGLLSVRPAS